MKDRKHVAWLYEQLPILVSAGVVPPTLPSGYASATAMPTQEVGAGLP